jgi:hypothetical protein
MKIPRGPVIIALAILLGGAGGWSLVRHIADSSKAAAKSTAAATPKKELPADEPVALQTKTEERKPASGFKEDEEAENAGALRNQRTLKFADQAAMDRFIAKAKGKGVAILGRIDRLNILRVGFLSKADLTGLLDGSENPGFIYPVSIPVQNDAGVQAGAVPFKDSLLQWLGVQGDNSSYGEGVKVGILDTGISSTSALASLKNFFLVDPPANPADWNGHGTAVASLIQQISPSADLYSFRISDDTGKSDTFLLSQGVLAAIDQGVDVINISFGGGNSDVLREAIEQAQKAGIVIFASPGNDGSTDGIAYPAAYPGVIGVGAVDAKGDHLLFSNSGDGVVMGGPGLSLLAQWTNDEQIYFSGTSASSPIALSTLVAIMSNNGTKMSVTDALAQLEKTLNDSGAPGEDPETGGGNVSLRSLNRTANVIDAAVTSNYATTDASGNPVLLVTVQNQGTTAISNSSLEVTIGGATNHTTIPSLAVNGISTFTVPFPAGTDPATIQSTVKVSGSVTDRNPSNNVRSNVSNPSTPAN